MEEQIKNCRIILGDNMEYMKNIPDKCFDLAVVDPPYGIGINNNMGRRKGDNKSCYKKITWDDEIPTDEYFEELFRISKNQIIWGANYFRMPPTKSFIVWRKPQMSENVSFSMVEYAWTNFDVTSKEWIGMSNEKNRFHPTQKPVKLYEWIYFKYAEKGMKILDTHLGSGSSAIAAYRVGIDLEFTGIEIDEEYYNNAVKRIKWETSQGSLF